MHYRQYLAIDNYHPLIFLPAVTCVALCFIRVGVEDFVVVLSYNVCHVLVSAVAHLHIVFVKNLVEFILFREVLLYQIEELLSDVSLDAFIKRWFIPGSKAYQTKASIPS